MKSGRTWAAVFALPVALLAGCSAKTVCFEGHTTSQVQQAYEHVFHPPPPPPRPSSSRSSSGWFDFDFRFDFSGLGESLAKLERIRRCLGIWSTSSERRWAKDRYERSDSTWWLLIPVEINSETAVTEAVDNGTNLRIAIYPANEPLLQQRFRQVQDNLEPGRKNHTGSR